MGKLTLLLGGARSGKSTLAERLASQRTKKVLYVATAVPFDDEMKLRINNHQDQRPDTWITIESPTGICRAVQEELSTVDVVLLDCVTLLVNNLFMKISRDPDLPNQKLLSDAVQQEINEMVVMINSSSADWIIVTNEVGLGLVPAYPLGRVYRDLLGWTNQRLAGEANEIYLMVAGLAVPLHEIRKTI
jgi:adenosylcobinamide kinase/adenosylcobinamide-phosphate guanylyltransferase